MINALREIIRRSACRIAYEQGVRDGRRVPYSEVRADYLRRRLLEMRKARAWMLERDAQNLKEVSE